MVIQLAFVFILSTHLRHLLQTSEHSLHYPIIRGIDDLPDFQRIRADEL